MSIKATTPNAVPPVDPMSTETMKPSVDAPSSPQSMSTTPAMPETMPDPKNLAQWAKAMTEGKAALHELDFDTFEKSMDSAVGVLEFYSAHRIAVKL